MKMGHYEGKVAGNWKRCEMNTVVVSSNSQQSVVVSSSQ